MVRARSWALALCVAAFGAGCAGTNFNRPAPDTFRLGKATRAEIVEKFGAPRAEGSSTRYDVRVTEIAYSYASAMSEPAEEGVIPGRSMSFFFVNDTLVGEEFRSSFKSDQSNFDDTKIPAIAKGKTTRAEVIQLLGQPTCRYFPPLVKAPARDGIGYLYTTTSGSTFSGFKVFKKALMVSFDGDRVADVVFSSGGTK